MTQQRALDQKVFTIHMDGDYKLLVNETRWRHKNCRIASKHAIRAIPGKIACGRRYAIYAIIPADDGRFYSMCRCSITGKYFYVHESYFDWTKPDFEIDELGEQLLMARAAYNERYPDIELIGKDFRALRAQLNQTLAEFASVLAFAIDPEKKPFSMGYISQIENGIYMVTPRLEMAWNVIAEKHGWTMNGLRESLYEKEGG